MYATANYRINFIAQLIPRCLLLAQSFLIRPDHVHRLCVAAVASIILILIVCFISFAYAEKHHLINSFFYGRVQFSFVDGGYPEFLGYVLELVACAIFVAFAKAHNKKQWYAWAAILLVTFMDDAFKVHETIGHFSSVGLGLSPVVGDLIGFAATGVLFAVLWFVGVRTIASKNDLSAYFVFTAYFAILMFFGVGVDAMHELLGKNMSQTLFTLFEDGGELITTALITLSALGMWLQQKHRVIALNLQMN
jgi:hypothetical protein